MSIVSPIVKDFKLDITEMAGAIEFEDGKLIAKFIKPVSKDVLFETLGNISFKCIESDWDGLLYKKIEIVAWSLPR